MKLKRFNKKNDQLLLVVYMFLLIYLGRSSIIAREVIGLWLSQAILLCLTIFVALLVLFRNIKIWKQIILSKKILLYLVISLFVLIVIVIKHDYHFIYISILFAISIGFLLSFIYDIEILARIFVYLVLFLTLYSLITNYVLRGILFSHRNLLGVFYNSSNIQFINLVFSVQIDDISYYRNFSIFREPGVFQFYLTLAMMLEIFIVKHKIRIQQLILFALAVGILTTFSTNGFIQLVFLTIIYFSILISNGFKLERRNIFIILASIFLGTYLIWQNNYIYWSVYNMFAKLTDLFNVSTLSRLDSIVSNIQLFFRSPLIGNKSLIVFDSFGHNTSSSLILYSLFGVIGGSFGAYIWIYFSISLTKTMIKPLRLFALIVVLLTAFMSFNTQDLLTDVFFWFFPIIILLDQNYFATTSFLSDNVDIK